jgi:hypothetical protein
MSNGTADRRAGGVRAAQFEDGNGRRVDVYTVNVRKAHALLGALAALLVIAGTVFGAVQIGVRQAVRDEIETQLSTEYSPLNRHIDARFQTGCVLRQQRLDNQLDKLNTDVATLTANQHAVQQQVSELRADVKLLLQRVQ